MFADKYALDKYTIRKQFPATYIVSGENKETLFQAAKPLGQNRINIYEGQAQNLPVLKIEWKAKKSLAFNSYKYSIVDRAHTPIGKLECQRTPVFSTDFTIYDIYDRKIGVIQPEEVGYVYTYFNVVINGKKTATFFRNAHLSLSYMMDLSGDKDKVLDRKFALAIAVILAATGIPMKKCSGYVDWQKPVVVGDELYRIKRRPV